MEKTTSQAGGSRPSIDVVIPLFNEQEVVRQLHHRVVRTLESLPLEYRILYVDDGSGDRTIETLIGTLRSGEGVELIRLSRNFGQSAAIQAGLAASQADCVVIMDGDLQDPPELISDLVERWMMGFEVVIARRTDRDEETWLRKQAFLAFHRFFRWISDHSIPANCGTFCLLDRRAAQAIRDLPESHRFFPGLRAWVGFDQGFVEYARPRRAAGSPKQTFGRLVRYAADGIFSYSRKPARLVTGLGFLQVLTGVTAVFGWSLWQYSRRGWVDFDLPTAIALLTLLGGIQLIGLGLVSELGFRIYEQVKARPPFVVQNRAVLSTYSRTESTGGGADHGDASRQRKAG